jgi:hypothetical protein
MTARISFIQQKRVLTERPTEDKADFFVQCRSGDTLA